MLTAYLSVCYVTVGLGQEQLDVLESLPDEVREALAGPGPVAAYLATVLVEVGRDDEAGDASFVFRWIVGTD